MKDLSHHRREYLADGLHREHLQDDPIHQFALWFEEACKAEILEPNAMTVATCGADGHPSQRTVLLKKFDAQGFVFFTNYGSNKAKQIAENANVSLHFLWLPLERQVNLSGTAEKISSAETLKYFITRPLESQLGAWASSQSGVISSRKALQMKLTEVKQKFRDGKVPVPSFWGGYRVVPRTIEFWQGGAGRLHDRFLYSKQEDSSWMIERLAP